MKKQFPEIDLACSAPDLFEEFCTVPWIVRMLGEIDRFHEYFEKGDIASVTIPDEIRRTVEALREMVASPDTYFRQQLPSYWQPPKKPGNPSPPC